MTIGVMFVPRPCGYIEKHVRRGRFQLAHETRHGVSAQAYCLALRTASALMSVGTSVLQICGGKAQRCRPWLRECLLDEEGSDGLLSKLQRYGPHRKTAVGRCRDQVRYAIGERPGPQNFKRRVGDLRWQGTVLQTSGARVPA